MEDAGVLERGAAALEPSEIQMSRSVNEAALEKLYDEHCRRLYRHAVSLTGSADDAEDAVQEVFVRVARARKLPRDPCAYLMRAVRNQCLTAIRARMRRDAAVSRLQMEPAPPTVSGQIHELPGLADAIKGLPTEQREVLLLKVVEQMTFEEIGRLTSIAPATAASRYRYALAKLQRTVETSNDG